MRAHFIDGIIKRKGLPASLYASDGVSNRQDTFVYVTNAKWVIMIGTTRADLIIGYAPTDLLVMTGARLLVYGMGTPGVGATNPASGVTIGSTRPAETATYLTIKPLSRPRHALYDRATVFALQPLPLTMTFTRIALPVGPLSPYGELAMTTGGAPSVTAKRTTVPAGLMNEFNPLLSQMPGPMPGGIVTATVPLGADVKLGDSCVLPNGNSAVVQQINMAFADDAPFALRVLLNETAGSGYSGGP